MDSNKSNKITEIVRLKQIIKKWKKTANANKNNNAPLLSNSNPNGGSKGINFLKRTLSFTETSLMSSSSSTSNDVVPKGYLAVCVGKELKKFVIPMEYLGHQAFGNLLREAEEEFGFQQEGVLKIPCEVSVFEDILKTMEHKTIDDAFFLNNVIGSSSSLSHHHAPMRL